MLFLQLPKSSNASIIVHPGVPSGKFLVKLSHNTHESRKTGRYFFIAPAPLPYVASLFVKTFHPNRFTTFNRFVIVLPFF